MTTRIKMNGEVIYGEILPTGHTMPENVIPFPRSLHRETSTSKKENMNFDFHVTGRTELDESGMKLVKENLIRKGLMTKAKNTL